MSTGPYKIDSDTLRTLEAFLPPQYTVAISDYTVKVILTDCIPGPVTNRDPGPWPFGFTPFPHMRCSECKGSVVLTPSGYVCAQGHGGCEEQGEPLDTCVCPGLPMTADGRLPSNPTHPHPDGTWWFYDETWADEYGPHADEVACNDALGSYCREML